MKTRYSMIMCMWLTCWSQSFWDHCAPINRCTINICHWPPLTVNSFMVLVSSLKLCNVCFIPFHLILPGPPGPPVNCRVAEMTETTAPVSWEPGMDNYSPILSFTIQARTPFFLGWQAVTTGRLVSSTNVYKCGGHAFSLSHIATWRTFEKYYY